MASCVGNMKKEKPRKLNNKSRTPQRKLYRNAITSVTTVKSNDPSSGIHGNNLRVTFLTRACYPIEEHLACEVHT